MADSAFQVGDRVKVSARPPYLKSAEHMPMLRPSDLVDIGEEGIILSRKTGGYLSVRFSRGAFLIDAQYLTPSLKSDVEPGISSGISSGSEESN